LIVIGRIIYFYFYKLLSMRLLDSKIAINDKLYDYNNYLL